MTIDMDSAGPTAEDMVHQQTIFVSTYKGRLINKFQIGVFWLIFKIRKIRNIRFVENFFLSSHRNFYNNDFKFLCGCGLYQVLTFGQLINLETVSYTHLTLPTNREV